MTELFRGGDVLMLSHIPTYLDKSKVPVRSLHESGVFLKELFSMDQAPLQVACFDFTFVHIKARKVFVRLVQDRVQCVQIWNQYQELSSTLLRETFFVYRLYQRGQSQFVTYLPQYLDRSTVYCEASRATSSNHTLLFPPSSPIPESHCLCSPL